MSHDVGVWIDHKKAIIVSIAAGEVTTRTLTSDIGGHPHYSGSQEGGGEKKYEQRHTQDLDRYYDDVVVRLASRTLFSSLGQVKRSCNSRSVCVAQRCRLKASLQSRPRTSSRIRRLWPR